MLNDILIRLRAMFRRKRVEGELDDEIRFHFDRQVEKYVREGMADDEARRRAKLEFGGMDQVKEECRDARGVEFLETFFQDMKFGLRMLRKAPGFAAVAILTLALGIGANTTIFSVINTVLLRPLPFPNLDRLVLVWETDASKPDDPDSFNIVSAPNFWDWEKQNDIFEKMAIFDSAGRGYNLSRGGEPERVSGVRVSADFFRVLGIEPLLGRTFLPEEETAGRDREVVLSYALWMRRYGGDPQIVGKQIRIDGEDSTVVGVMPQKFRFQFWSHERELWVPMGYTEGDRGRDSNSFLCIARLKHGVTIAQARTEMHTIGQRLMQEYPKEDHGMSATVEPLATAGMQEVQKTLMALLAAVGFVLLIACVNVTNLMLARSATRNKEIAMRRALGARRLRILRQLLTESVLLATLGGVAGLLLALGGVRLLGSILPDALRSSPLRPVTEIPLDTRVFLFALGISCAAGILCGLVPAFTAYKGDVNGLLKEGASRGSTESGGRRLRNVLAAAEVALAVVLIAGAGLLITSVARLLGVDPGFNTKNALVMGITTPQVDLYYGPPTNELFCEQLQQHVGSIPGVLSVSSISTLPLAGMATRAVTAEGEPYPGRDNNPWGKYNLACPSYFRTMGIPIIEGRELLDRDAVDSEQVAVINESMAHKYWGKKDPLGRRFKIGHPDSTGPWITVVGISRDNYQRGLDRSIYPEFFRPFTQAGWPVMTIIVRTASSPLAFTQVVKKALAEVNPDVPVSGIQTLDDIVTDSVGDRRFPMLLLSAFGVLALALAGIGIYGVVSYGVSQRTQEIGVRMAFGAQPRDVVKLVVGGSMAWTLAGIGAGILGALGTARLLSGLLFGVKATDPFVLGGVSLLLLAVAMAASYIPARRAMRVDPMVALRYE
ncbi:MAG TPA: ABC transporter permease [Candidatus Acidoferrum sp.]|nr:ABC transporter permease [Candidatus Acidoferrum sp.]